MHNDQDKAQRPWQRHGFRCKPINLQLAPFSFLVATLPPFSFAVAALPPFSFAVASLIVGGARVLLAGVARRIKLIKEQGARLNNNSQMRKKVSRQKDIKTGREKPSPSCVPLALVALPPRHLKTKYYFPQIETYHFRTSNNLLYDPYSLQALQLAQSRKQSLQDQTLMQYFTFGQTVQCIRGVITRRVQKDFYGWVDFRQHFSIMNVYYLRRKQLVQTGRQIENYLKHTSELQSTGSDDDKHVREYIRQKVKKQLDQQRLVRPHDANSLLDLQKLTKHIDAMVEKIADLSAIHPLPRKRTSQQSNCRERQPNCRQRQLNCKGMQLNCKEISEIEQVEKELFKSPKSPKQPKQPYNYQESYGLDCIRPKQARQKKLNKMTLRSIDRLNGYDQFKQPPDTPSPRNLHRLNQADQEQLARNRSKMPPLSPNNHSSSLRDNNSRSKGKASRKR